MRAVTLLIIAVLFMLFFLGMIFGANNAPVNLQIGICCLVTLTLVGLSGATIWIMGLPGRSERRRAQGLCVKCGYDLRASKDRCPECGQPIE